MHEPNKCYEDSCPHRNEVSGEQKDPVVEALKAKLVVEALAYEERIKELEAEVIKLQGECPACNVFWAMGGKCAECGREPPKPKG
jgi:hypothetical protein